MNLGSPKKFSPNALHIVIHLLQFGLGHRDGSRGSIKLVGVEGAARKFDVEGLIVRLEIISGTEAIRRSNRAHTAGTSVLSTLELVASVVMHRADNDVGRERMADRAGAARRTARK